jgi:hypothetical protein
MYQFARGITGSVACLWSASAAAAPHATADAALSTPPYRAASSETRIAKYAARSGELDSLLLREDEGAGGQRVMGVTRLADGTRLWEEARFDPTGKLLRAESMCVGPTGSSETVILEAVSGIVETRTAEGFHRWSVPTDYPWIWIPHGCGGSAQSSALATPVSALVATAGAPHDGARRLIDTRRFASYTVTGDQVVVPEEDPRSCWVVLGDDALLVRDGLPERWRANALGVDVEAH